MVFSSLPMIITELSDHLFRPAFVYSESFKTKIFSKDLFVFFEQLQRCTALYQDQPFFFFAGLKTTVFLNNTLFTWRLHPRW